VHALETLARGADETSRRELLLSLARARLAQGASASAIEAIEELLAFEPDNLAAWELAYAACSEGDHPQLLARAAEQLAAHLDGAPARALLEESAHVRLAQLGDHAGAARIYQALLARDPDHPRAYERLHALHLAQGDHDALVALVRQRVAQTDDAGALTRLLYELAQRERARGQLAAALAAIDDLLMLDDEHLGGLALSAEIHTSRGAFREAVSALETLARATSLPIAQRRLAALGAADFLENKLDDAEGALAQLEQLLMLTPSDPTLHVRIADLASRRGLPEREATALERAIELEGERATQAALSVRLADLLAKRLGRPHEAASAYRQALEWAPGHLEAARSLLAIADDRSALARVDLELRARAGAMPHDPAPLRTLRTLAALEQDDDLDFLALSALHAIGALSEEEELAHRQAALAAQQSRVQAIAPLGDAEREALLGPDVDARVAPLLAAVLGAAAEIDQLTPERFGVGRGQRVSPREPHPVRDELRTLAAPLGLVLGDLYVGGEPERIVVLPREDELGVIVGRSVTSPLEAALRHAASLQLAAVRLGTLPLLTRSAREAAALIDAALLSEGLARPGGPTREALGELPRSVGRALPRRVRRALPELARPLRGETIDLAAACNRALARTRRLALLLSGELAAALLDAGGDEAAHDLLRTWIGAPMSAARRKLRRAT